MSRPVRLVVVDDDQRVRRSIVMRLQLEPRVEVVGDAPDGPTAMAVARAAQPDAVLLDLNLEGMSGLELCRRFADLNLPVVMFSLDDSEEAQRQCIASGAAAFVAKRAPTAELVEAILRAPQPFMSARSSDRRSLPTNKREFGYSQAVPPPTRGAHQNAGP